jgi:protein-L-isoaspartate(D-aspartate) O-methyltransferase
MQSEALRGSGLLPAAARAEMINRLRRQGILRQDVLATMEKLPRHLFVDEAMANHAYSDMSLPIGFSQTISQPYIVARMTEVMLNQNVKLSKILEIGTGCGYQTMVLSKFADKVFTVERIKGLLDKTRQRFRDFSVNNIRNKFDDGMPGWDAYAPYDGIIVTAAAPELPQALARQLKIGGVMVLPIQARNKQILCRVERNQEGVHIEQLEPVQFVPLLNGVIK